MQRVLFPGIQLAVFAVGLYLIFSVIVMHSSFNLFYMIGFMALGMIASLICAVIEYFVMKKRQSRQYALLREEFIRDLQVRSGESVGVGQAYAARLERAFPGKQSAGASELTNTLWERTYDEKLLLRLGTVENARLPPELLQASSSHGDRPSAGILCHATQDAVSPELYRSSLPGGNRKLGGRFLKGIPL